MARRRIIRERIIEIHEEDGRRTRRRFVQKKSPQPRIEQKPLPQPMSSNGSELWLGVLFGLFVLALIGCGVALAQ